jgi:uncharacterized protein YecE (DUF72 family)
MAAYFKIFSLAEVQKTFYKLPRIETARRWREKAPKDFEFTLKAWQLITHPPSSPTYRRAGLKVERPENLGFFRPTREVYDAWDRTIDVSLALDARVLVFQCPASFKPTEENLSNMRDFFNSIDRKGRILAWEPRGSWSRALVRSTCQELGLVHCVDLFSEEPALQRGTAYLRLHGFERGRMYCHEYTSGELKLLLNKCLSLKGSRIYCLFNNLEMGKNASEFKELLGLQSYQEPV